jgi:hypothetical protein
LFCKDFMGFNLMLFICHSIMVSSEKNYVGTNLSTPTEWKIFEKGSSKTNFNWLFDISTVVRDESQYLTLNEIRVYLSQLSHRIVIGDPGVYPTKNMGKGAPRSGYGFNLIWGNAQANFDLKCGQIAGLTVISSGVVNTPQN